MKASRYDVTEESADILVAHKMACYMDFDAGNSNGKFSDTNSSMALKNVFLGFPFHLVCPQNRSFWGLSCLLMFLTIQALTANLLKFYQMSPKRLLSKEIL